MGNETKTVNHGGKTLVVDRVEELRPLRSSSKLNTIKTAIDNTIQSNNSQADKFASNFSLNIKGDYELSTEFEDDGITVKGYTDITAEVLYYRSGHNMLITNIPESAYSWYILGDGTPIQQSGKTIRITKTGQYQCIVSYSYQISAVETGIERIIPIRLSATFTIGNGTITLYTRSNAETTAELLQSIDNLRWFPDPDSIDRTEKYLWRKESTDGGTTWKYFRIEGLDGADGKPGEDGKPAPNTLIQYQYSDSDRTPPNKFIPFVFGGGLVYFKGGLVGDNNSKDWVKDPPKTGKYKWMRVSTDNGATWDYSVITGPEPSFFELLSSKDNFRQNERGAVDEEDSITFWVVRHGISSTEKTTWNVSPESLLPNASEVDSDSIEIVVPVGFQLGSFKVSASIGTMSETLSKEVFGQKNGTLVPKKLATIDRTTDPPEPFPATLSDGVSPVRDGDYLLVRLSDNGKSFLVPYRYSEAINPSTGEIEGWVPSSSTYPNHSEIMGSVLQEVLASSQTTPSVSAIYGFFQSLVANDAFINFLCAQYLEITGAIYGGGYDKLGNNLNNKTGFHISKDGLIQITNSIVKNSQIDGSIECNADGIPIFYSTSKVESLPLTISNKTAWKLGNLIDIFPEDSRKKITVDGVEYYAEKITKETVSGSLGGAVGGTSKTSTITIPLSGTYTISISMWSNLDIYGFDLYISSKKRGSIFSIGANSLHKELIEYFEEDDEIEIKITQSSIFGSSDGEISITPYRKIFQISGLRSFYCDTDYYLQNRITYEGFDSNSHIGYASISNIANALEANKKYYLEDVSVTYNGSSISINSIMKIVGFIMLFLQDGSTIQLSYNNDDSAISTGGYHDISGSFKIQRKNTGIYAYNILPALAGGSYIGEDGNRYIGYFSSLTANTINGDKVLANVNSDGTSNKVWGAVAN